MFLELPSHLIERAAKALDVIIGVDYEKQEGGILLDELENYELEPLSTFMQTLNIIGTPTIECVVGSVSILKWKLEEVLNAHDLGFKLITNQHFRMNMRIIIPWLKGIKCSILGDQASTSRNEVLTNIRLLLEESAPLSNTIDIEIYVDIYEYLETLQELLEEYDNGKER
jgi:hypothetical protein